MRTLILYIFACLSVSCKTNTPSGLQSDPETAASQSRFACGSVIGAGSGDFDFREICVSEKTAVANTGAFEGNSYFYNVTSDPSMPKFYYLTPDQSKKPLGNPLTLILKLKPGYKIESLVDTLIEKNITQENAGGRVWVAGHPVPGHGGDEVSYIADHFKLTGAN